jgi:NADH-ubiquinone oxidoreductase chain 2
MVLSAAIDSGYIFITLVAILTSVVSAVYYLNVIKEVFFSKPDYKINPELENLVLHGNIITNTLDNRKEVRFTLKNIVLSSSLTITISILTLIILLFIFIPTE